MLSLRKVREIKSNITAVLFKKDEYTFEGIIRWLMERDFGCEYFEETDNYYVFKQKTKGNFRSYEFHIIEDFNIAVEVGSAEDGEINEKGSYPEF